MDERLRELLRRACADPDDLGATRRAVAGCARARCPAPPELADRVSWPPRAIEVRAALRVFAERGDRSDVAVGTTPGRVELPEHRTWYVVLEAREPEPDVWTELERLEAPGVRVCATGKRVALMVARALRLPSLRWLSLDGGAGDAALAALGPQHPLTDLHVSSRRVTPAGLAAARAPGLARLSLDRAVKVKDLGGVGGPGLRRLSLRLAGLGLRTIQTLPTLPALTHLDLAGNQVTAAMLAALRPRLPGLRELVVSPDARAKQAFVAGLGAWTEREASSVVDVPLAVRDLEPLAALTRLRSLYLDVGLVEAPDALARMGSLRQLGLERAGGAALLAASDIAGLRRLALVDPLLGTAGGLRHVARLAGLEDLAREGFEVEGPEQLLGALRDMCPPGLRRLRLAADWRDAATVLPQLDLPGVQVVQEDLELPGNRPSSLWALTR